LASSLRRKTEDALHISPCVKDANNLERPRFVAINNEVRIDEEEAVPLIREILAPVA
jgi:hypothetical protein